MKRDMTAAELQRRADKAWNLFLAIAVPATLIIAAIAGYAAGASR